MKLVDPTLIRKVPLDQPIRIGIALYTTENILNAPLQWALATDTTNHFESFDRRFYRYINRNRVGVIKPDLADVPRKEGWHLTNVIHIANTYQESHLLDTFLCTSPLLIPHHSSDSSGYDHSAPLRQNRRGDNARSENWVLSALVRLHNRQGGTFALPLEPQAFVRRVVECVKFLERNRGAEHIPSVITLDDIRRLEGGYDADNLRS
ncbi:hypothetical protein CVT24_008626 [Panaeolus cyanescens]|uniref:Uncharacterized protein n=1 Tax=Panaeolus cyanescens TaxID=181874 RepID=A0A409VCW6_9AGAR|nr:hypothetical protein CVT24_008626 [Panaeolus cyanescens]